MRIRTNPLKFYSVFCVANVWRKVIGNSVVCSRFVGEDVDDYMQQLLFSVNFHPIGPKAYTLVRINSKSVSMWTCIFLDLKGMNSTSDAKFMHGVRKI